MNNKEILCFSENRETVSQAFKDYMFHYFAENKGGRDKFPYDANVSFDEKEKKMNKLMLSEVSRMANIDLSMSGVSKEMMAANPQVRWAAYAVVSSLIDMIIPDVIDRTIGIYSEQRYVGWGDSQIFDVEPNDLFYITKAGRDQRTVEFQKQYIGQVTVVPENHEITVAVNFYKVLCGLESLARFVTKAILSLELEITRDVYFAFENAVSGIPTTPADGNLHATGWDEREAIRIAQTVQAYNNGAKPIFMGTKLALRNILPADANYRYSLDDSDYVTLGYIRDFVGYDVLELPQVANWDDQYTTALNDNRIYIVSPASQKPVKIVYEGSTWTNTMNFFQNADLTETTTIAKSYATGIATNGVVGVITLD